MPLYAHAGRGFCDWTFPLRRADHSRIPLLGTWLQIRQRLGRGPGGSRCRNSAGQQHRAISSGPLRRSDARHPSTTPEGSLFMNAKSYCVSLIALIAATGLARAEDVTIAVAGPMTGAVATIGEQLKHGAELAAEAVNKNGGAGGRTIKISIQDDACDPKQAVAVANRIVSQGIKFVDGHACSGSSIPAARGLCRERRADDEPGVEQSQIDRRCRQERLDHDHAALRPRRRAGQVHRAVDQARSSATRRSPSCTTRAPTAKDSPMS